MAHCLPSAMRDCARAVLHGSYYRFFRDAQTIAFLRRCGLGGARGQDCAFEVYRSGVPPSSILIVEPPML